LAIFRYFSVPEDPSECAEVQGDLLPLALVYSAGEGGEHSKSTLGEQAVTDTNSLSPEVVSDFRSEPHFSPLRDIPLNVTYSNEEHQWINSASAASAHHLFVQSPPQHRKNDGHLRGWSSTRECLLESKPNILFIVSDDHNFRYAGYTGNDLVRTPTIDALAERGTVFTQLITDQSHCTPSRYAIMTGRLHFDAGQNDALKKPNGVFKTLPELAREVTRRSGSPIATSLSGKLKENLSVDVFDRIHGVFHENAHHYKDIPVVGQDLDTGTRWTRTIPQSPTVVFTDSTLQLLEWHTSRKQRFLHMLCYTAPHCPRTPNPESLMDRFGNYTNELLQPSWTSNGVPSQIRPQSQNHRNDRMCSTAETANSKRDRAGWQREMRGYFALVEQMDQEMNRIVQWLEDHDELNNTVIIYSSDNGLTMGALGFSTKSVPYEDSIRIPMVLAGPCIPEGRVSSALVTHADWMPTLAEMLSADNEAGSGYGPQHLLGKSWLGELEDGGVDRAEHRPAQLYGWKNDVRMIRTAKGMKFMQWYDGRNVVGEEMYDVIRDPLELRDLLAGSPSAEIAALAHELRREMSNERKLRKDSFRTGMDP